MPAKLHMNAASAYDNPETAMRAGVAKVARPVVVVDRLTARQEVLGEQHVRQVVAARRIARDADGRGVHRFVGHAANNAEGAGRCRKRTPADDGVHRADRRRTVVGDQTRRQVQVDVDPVPGERPLGCRQHGCRPARWGIRPRWRARNHRHRSGTTAAHRRRWPSR